MICVDCKIEITSEIQSKTPYTKRCKSCYNIRQRQLVIRKRRKDPEAAAAKRMLSSARCRAKKIDVLFDLKYEDIKSILPIFCPVLGVPLDYLTGSRYLTPSIDRINPKKGYTSDNIQIMSFRANVMKSNATETELVAFANWVYHTYR